MTQTHGHRAHSEPAASGLPAVQSATFVQHGEDWTIGYGAASFPLRNVLGLSYIHRLLQHPGEQFHALDLLTGSAAGEVLEPGSSGAARLGEGENLAIGRLSDTGPLLDAQAKQEYRHKIVELKEELSELRERGSLNLLGERDYQRREEIESELEVLTRHLAQAVGIFGRDRRSGSAAERARLNVTRAIRAAIQKIAERHAMLGELLGTCIKTGSFCSYLPNPRAPIEWKFAAEGMASVPTAATAPLPHLQTETSFIAPLASRTKFVGREEERAVLRRCLEGAKNGAGRVVILAGPPGIGKTRTAREAGEEARFQGFTALAGNCYDRDDSVPFVPFVELLEVVLAQNPSPKAIRDILGDQAVELSRVLPQLHRLLPDLPSAPQVSPEQARRLLFNAVLELIERWSAVRPLLLLLEDLHWADEGTLSLLVHLGRSISKIPVMIIVTHRDHAIDMKPPLTQALDELTRLRILERVQLRGLPQPAVAKMIEGMSGRGPSQGLVDLIYSNSDGNPLFVQELVRHLEEAKADLPELLEQGAIVLPHSLRLVIGRRLRLVSKETIKILGTAAVIGRSFTFGLLEAATGVDPDQLIDLVEEAEKAGLISSKLQYPEALFRFAHDLIRQAVLDNLSNVRRQRLHLSVAEAIEQLYPKTAEDHAEDLAHHLWNAGTMADATKTINYLQIAGTKAVKASANMEAVRHFRRALQIVNSAGDSPERIQTELMLQLALSVPLSATKGYASPELEAVFARTRYLCRQTDETPQLFPVLWGMWLFHTARAEHITARELAVRCLRLARGGGDPALLLAAHHALGVSLSTLGDFEPALEHLEQTITLYDRDRHAALAFQFGQDFGVVARSHAALDLCYLGYVERALTMTEEALDLARKLSHPHSLTAALIFASRVHRLLRDPRATQERAEEALRLSGESDFGFWRPVALVFHGWALAQGSGIVEGIAEMREGLNIYRAAGARVGQPTFLASLADGYGRTGRPAEGLDTLSEAYAIVKQSRERWSESELYLLEGELTLKLSETQRPQPTHQKRAEECFLRARQIACDQKAKLLELRATVSLHRLWAMLDKSAEARQLLQETYGWFSEGFDSPDLFEAAQIIESGI